MSNVLLLRPTDVSAIEEHPYRAVKQMFQDSAFVTVTLGCSMYYLTGDDIEHALSSRILFSYFASQRESFMTFDKTCQCSLKDAIDIVRTASGKKHVVVAVDELHRVQERSRGDFQKFMRSLFTLMDDCGENRVNFVFTSISLATLEDMMELTGRSYQVSLPCEILLIEP